jgi:DNA invertase Pin-like site-specific DNA recombinase
LLKATNLGKYYQRISFPLQRIKRVVMKIGYARVSTLEQNLDMQLDALKRYGIPDENLYTEKVSGKESVTHVLNNIIENMQTGDQLVVWKLDRLGRKSKELLQLHDILQEKGIELVSLTEKLDTSTSTGKFMFQMLCGIAEMERNVINERVKAGLDAARAKGRVGGRPWEKEATKRKKLAIQAAEEYKQKLLHKDRTMEDICKSVGISKGTLYKYLRQEGVF